MIFKNREEAGEKLAILIEKFEGKDVVVYALPRGGVVIGAEIAHALNAPLDLIITRKIGHPNQQEYAVGAVAENGQAIFDDTAISDIDKNYLVSETERQKLEARRRREVYLKGKKSIPCEGKIAILVDDGIATGLTIKAAIRELKMHYQPKKIVVAVPVAPFDIIQEIETQENVEVVALEIPEQFFGAIGSYYQNFPPVTDEEVINLLANSQTSGPTGLSTSC